jgi:hypothetical protein
MSREVGPVAARGSRQSESAASGNTALAFVTKKDKCNVGERTGGKKEVRSKSISY